VYHIGSTDDGVTASSRSSVRRTVSDREGQPCRPDLSALERRVIDADAVRTLGSAWQKLAERAARSPFESPAWLLPWVDHYGSDWQLRMVTWWRGNDLVPAPHRRWRH
jgi:CelD/BcsL family acetyltransferase involved in cellulose biosynthesis